MAEPVRVVLCMNVKNEARVIERCLAGALPIVDGWVISDTGSTDATTEIVAAVAERYGKPGQLVRHPWRNFGHNRTLSAGAARDWVNQRGWPAERTYLLFLDADMVLEASSDFDKQKLDATYYQLVQQTDGVAYANTRLACLSHQWQAVGATHEFWQAQGEGRGERLDTLFIRDLGDGGSKGGKLIRDYRLLKLELARDPTNARHTFYLAQTCFDGGRFAEAVRWYVRRCALGGWDEERWYARYRQGLSLLRLGDLDRAAGVLLEAFDERPTRAEPLWALARSQRERGRHHSALLLAERGLQIPFPAEEQLFVEKSVYEWRLWEEVMISAWYVAGRRELGFAACERLLLRRGHDDSFYNYVACNEAFYHAPLPHLRAGSLDLEYRCANPTVTRIGENVIMNVLQLDAEDGAVSSPGGGKRNITIEWDRPSGRAGAARESRGIAPSWATASAESVLEDMRWTVHAGRVWFTATWSSPSEAADPHCTVLGRMSPTLEAVEHLVPLQRDGHRQAKRNWLPWSREDALFVVAECDPLEVLRVDPETGATSLDRASTASFRAAHFQGSAPPLAIPDRPNRWLLLTQEVARRDGGDVYAHRFVELDACDGVVAASRPFHFDHVGIERAAGVCDLGDGTLLITYCHEDRDARWIEQGWRPVLDSLRSFSD